jgi:methyl-accepting chemotaxis protein
VTVRTKLLLGYGFCFLLLLVISVSAFWGFSHLGQGIDRILRENYESVSASMGMMDALERQDNLSILRLLNPDDEPGAMDELEARFDAALGKVEANITMVEERGIIRRVQEGYRRYREAREDLVDRHPQEPLAAYQRDIHPRFKKVKEAVQELVSVNRRAMLEADRRARTAVSVNAAWLGFIIVVALISVAVIYRWLNRDVLIRLEEIREVAELGSGDAPRRRVSVQGNDELARIGKSLNATLDKQQALNARAEGDLRHSRQLVLGLLGLYEEAYLLMGLDGRVIASNLASSRDQQVAAVAKRLKTSREALLTKAEREERHTVELDLGSLGSASLRLVSTDDDRPVGWLATTGFEEVNEAHPL